MSDSAIEAREVCPECKLPPSAWRERPKFGSRELYWIGCRRDGHLTGGISHNTALQAWSRLVLRLKDELAVR